MNKWVRVLLALTLSLFVSSIFAKNNEYAVLAYHSVVDDTADAAHKKYYPQTISATQLIHHFNWLKENGYNVISWQQVLDAAKGGKELPERAVLLSFDDGYETMYSVIFPLLKAYKYHAVFAPVTGWLDTPETKKIRYGNIYLDRSAFVTWQQVKELQQSGLVEIASHTNDSHYGQPANPAGSLLPAMVSPRYQDGKYETEQQYQERILKDLSMSSKVIERNVNRKPSIIVWPYGQFNDTDVALAHKVGMDYHFSLNSDKLNRAEDPHVGRLLIDAETSLDILENYLNGVRENSKLQRVVHVDLDYVYDTNPIQQKKNLDKLIERIYNYGVTTVYLQAYADSDGNGVADALYFPNKHLPVKADIFGQVAWQLMTRANVKVYAWMPVMAFDLRKSGKPYQYVVDKRINAPAKDHYLRLSPYQTENVDLIKSIYRDLSFHAKFNGILFHDDAFLTDFEGETSTNETKGKISEQARQKTKDLIQLTMQLKEALAPYFKEGAQNIKTARNIYASLITEPSSEEWFAQNLVDFTQNYDTTAIMAMPYMEHEQNISSQQAYDWFDKLIQQVRGKINMNKVLFEFQTVNWRTGKSIPEEELINWITLLEKYQIRSFGYYPDNFIENLPNLTKIKPYVSLNSDAARK